MPFDPKISLILAAQTLQELLPQLVFTGGAVLPAYVSDKSAPLPRTGRNLTVVADVAHQADWAGFLQSMKVLGFVPVEKINSTSETWSNTHITLHITPAHVAISSGKFSWYEEGLFHSHFIPLDTKYRIRVLTLPYVIASFLEQIPDQSDLRFCTAWQDLVYLFAYHDNPTPAIAASFYEIRNFLQTRLRKVASHHLLEEAIFYALGTDAHSTRVAKVKSRLADAAGLSPRK